MPQSNLRFIASAFVLLVIGAANFIPSIAQTRDGTYAADFVFSLEGHQHSLAARSNFPVSYSVPPSAHPNPCEAPLSAPPHRVRSSGPPRSSSYTNK
jgi:hypothetical protein